MKLIKFFTTTILSGENEEIDLFSVSQKELEDIDKEFENPLSEDQEDDEDNFAEEEAGEVVSVDEVKQILDEYEKNPESIKGDKKKEKIVKLAEAQLAKQKENGSDNDDSEDDSEDIFESKGGDEDSEDFQKINESNMSKYIRKKYNIDIKKDGLGKFFESVEKMRANSHKVAEAETTLKEFDELIDSMPIEIINAMKAFRENKDYVSAFQNSFSEIANFKIDPDNVSKKEAFMVCKKYFPDETGSQEEFDTEDPATKKIINTSLSLYRKEKKVYDDQKLLEKQANDKFKEDFQTSLNESKEELLKAFPQFKKTEISKLENDLLNIKDLFFDKKGTPKKDAMIKIALAKEGLPALTKRIELINKYKNSKKVDEGVANEVKKAKREVAQAEVQNKKKDEKILKRQTSTY